MPIQFPCEQCGTTLRVPDSSAGKQARCPSCQGLSIVPSQDAPSQENAGDSGAQSRSVPPPVGEVGGSSYPPEKDNPYQSPSAASAEKPAPELNQGEFRNTRVDVSRVMDRAFTLWKDNLGLLLGASVVVTIVGVAGEVAGSIAGAVVGGRDQEVANFVNNVVLWLPKQAIYIWFAIGMTDICLKLCRQQHAEFTDLFGGTRIFLPVFGAYVLATLCLSLACCLLIVPGVILLLMYWPYYYIQVDREESMVDSFKQARIISDNNWGTILLLVLISIGLYVVGFLTLCIGLVFVGPLVSLMWTVAYLMMSGQMGDSPQQFESKESRFA